MIRALTRDDLVLVTALGQSISDEAPSYAGQVIDEAYSLEYLNRAFDAGILFGVIDGFNRGFMFGSCAGTWHSPTLLASDWLLYVTPEDRGSGVAKQLVLNFEDAARIRGAKKLYVGSSTGLNDEGVRKLYELMGYSSVGSSLVKEL